MCLEVLFEANSDPAPDSSFWVHDRPTKKAKPNRDDSPSIPRPVALQEAVEAARLFHGTFPGATKLGEGAFGEAWAWNGCVIKRILHYGDPNLLAQAKREVCVLEKVRTAGGWYEPCGRFHPGHPNVVALLETAQTPHEVRVCMEHGGVDLFEVSAASPGPLQSSLFFPQIWNGVGFLHSHNIVHRDLKLENFLVDATGRLRVADFGLSKILTNEERGQKCISSVVGSKCYAAPEVWLAKERPYEGFAADVFSLGVVLFCLVFGRMPIDTTEPTTRMFLFKSLQEDKGLSPFAAVTSLYRSQEFFLDTPDWVVQTINQTMAIAPERRLLP